MRRQSAVVTLTVLAALVVPTAASATFPGGNGLIAFYDDQNGGIYTIHSDGTHRKMLADGYDPAWSPNGKRIVFVADKGADTEIFTMTAKGKDKRRLTDDKKSEWQPAFSPDGRRVVFNTGEMRDEFGPIYVMNANGKHRDKLVPFGGDSDWSVTTHSAKDGLIAYDTVYFGPTCSGIVEVLTVKPNGAGNTLRPFGCQQPFEPSWKPNGKGLAFGAYPPGENSDIYVGSLQDDDTLERMTDSGGPSAGPAWSPQADQIVYDESLSGLWLVDPTAPLVETQIPNTDDVDGAAPTWQPK
jgi:Tol biopolymer transport system component